MKAFQSLLLALLLVATSSTPSAEDSRSQVTRAGKSSFSISIPEGWKVGKERGTHQAGELLFDLVPSNPESKCQIIVVYYPGKVPITAQRYMEGLTYDGNVELPRIDGLAGWTIFAKGNGQIGKFGTAYYQIGGGTLVVDLSIQKGGDLDLGEKASLELLKAFNDLGEAK